MLFSFIGRKGFIPIKGIYLWYNYKKGNMVKNEDKKYVKLILYQKYNKVGFGERITIERLKNKYP
jgi:hypothetical protein